MRRRAPIARMLIPFAFMLSISMAYPVDSTASLKELVESEKCGKTAGLFINDKGGAISYEEFLAELETGRWNYSIRRNSENKIMTISLFPLRREEADGDAEAGKPAPEFSVTCVDGKKITLAGLRGRVVVIKFGSSQCKPCQEDWELIGAIPEAFKGKAVDFLYLQVDDRQAEIPPDCAYRAAVGQWETAARFDVTGFPTHCVLDPMGIIRWKAKGSGWKTAEIIIELVASIIDQKPYGGNE